MTNSDIIARVIKDEGGDKYTCNPADPGGATKWGITIPALTDYRGASTNAVNKPTAEDIKALTFDDAVAFYEWLMATTKIGLIQNDLVRYWVFDAAVHTGRQQATKLLQRALGVKDDGVLGVVTLAAVPLSNGERMCRLFGVEQMLFYGRLAAKNLTDADRDGIPDQLEFLPGYLNRLAAKMREVA